MLDNSNIIYVTDMHDGFVSTSRPKIRH